MKTFTQFLLETNMNNTDDLELTDDLAGELRYWLNKPGVNKYGCTEVYSIGKRTHGKKGYTVVYYDDDEKKRMIDVTFDLEQDGTVTDLNEID